VGWRKNEFNRIRQMAPIYTISIVFARWRQRTRRHSVVSCAETAEPIDLPFGLWTQVGRRKHKFNHIRKVAPMDRHGRAHLAPPNEYDWTVRLQRRCVLMSNYFDYLLLLLLLLLSMLLLSCNYIIRRHVSGEVALKEVTESWWRWEKRQADAKQFPATLQAGTADTKTVC